MSDVEKLLTCVQTSHGLNAKGRNIGGGGVSGGSPFLK